MDDWKLRSRMLLGDAAMDRLARSHVLVLGLGGVGSFAAEALARAGVGELTLVDHDTVGPSNINRQLCALHSTIGQYKADVTARRAKDINPEILAHPMRFRYSADSRDGLFGMDCPKYDYIVDAIDLVSCKLDLIETAQKLGIPVISALGTGNKLDASGLRVTDISKTENCPLARVIRKELRYRGIRHHKVVYSPELSAQSEQREAPPPGRRSVPGSLVWVPGAAGLMLAGAVVRDLCGL